MITGTIVLNLTHTANDRHEVGKLYGIPTGARVIVNVGSRTIYEPDTVRHLADHADRLHYDVYGDLGAVKAWVSALRSDGAVW